MSDQALQQPKTEESAASSNGASAPAAPLNGAHEKPAPPAEEQIEITRSSAIPREILAGGEPITDIPEFKPDDPLTDIAPTRLQSIFSQLRDPAVAAHEIFEAIRGGVTGIGTSESRILSALANKNRADIEALIHAYHEHYDRDLEADLKADLRDSPKLQKAVDTILHAQHPASTAALLHIALTIPADHRELVNETLGRLDPDEMIALREEFRRQCDADIKDVLTSKLSGDDLRMAIAILEKNQYDAYAVRLHEVLALAQRDTTPLARLITSLGQDDLGQTGRAFARIYGGSVLDLSSKILTERQLEALGYALKGDSASAQAVLLKDALSGSGDIRVLAEVLLSAENEVRIPALQRYLDIFNREFGDELHRTQDLPAGTRLLVERILTNGSVQLPDYLYRELTDAHLDPARLKVLFSALSLERNNLLIGQCREIYGLDVEKVIAQRLSGGERFDVRMSMIGRPEAVDDLLDIANGHHEFDRAGGVYGICSRLLDAISPLGRIYDRSIASLNQHFHQRNRPDRLFMDEDCDVLLRLAQYCEGDSISYRNAKEKLAGFIARSCAALVAIIGFSLVNLLLYGTDFGMPASILFGLAVGLFVHGIVSLNLRGNSHEGRGILDDVKETRRSKRGRRLKHGLPSGCLLISHR